MAHNARTWDDVFMKMADAVAERSKDPSTQVGAVLVSPDHRQVAIGYNGFPPSVPDVEDVLNKFRDFDSGPRAHEHITVPLGGGLSKYDVIVHAEKNALANCHVRPEEWTLYITAQPCMECAKDIAAAGITRVVCRRQTGKQNLGYEKALSILNLANVRVDLVGAPPPPCFEHA